MKLNLEHLKPVNEILQLRNDIFSKESEPENTKWRIFKSYICRTSFMVEHHYFIQKGAYLLCNKRLGKNKTVIHHLNYDHLCKYDYFLREKKPTAKRPERTVQIARCKNCDNKQECVNKISLVHKRCHHLIHKNENTKIRKSGKNDEVQLPLFGESKMESQRAKEIIQLLADGVNPITGEEFPPDSPYNNPEIIRAFLQ